MKHKIIIITVLLMVSTVLAQTSDEQKINKVLDNWHLAAANADFEAYFGNMTKEGVFLGTDAMENWQNTDDSQSQKIVITSTIYKI